MGNSLGSTARNYTAKANFMNLTGAMSMLSWRRKNSNAGTNVPEQGNLRTWKKGLYVVL
jgi:hypothetical protein